MRSVDEKTSSDLFNKLDEIFKEQDTVPVRRGKRKSVDKTAATGGERILLKRNACLHLTAVEERLSVLLRSNASLT